SLVSLMESEEGNALSAQARECLGRLSGAARRAGVMVQFLKKLANLAGTAHEPAERIELAHMGREVRAEVNRLFPERTFSYDMRWEAPVAYTGRRALHQAIVEVLRCGIDWLAEAAANLALASRPQGAN